jgi:hypothetical protein
MSPTWSQLDFVHFWLCPDPEDFSVCDVAVRLIEGQDASAHVINVLPSLAVWPISDSDLVIGACWLEACDRCFSFHEIEVQAPLSSYHPTPPPLALYGHANGKALEITSDIALWYRAGTPPLPVRWVLVRDPDAKRDPQAFFSTDITREPADIIALYVRRWQIEVTFAETRAHLGVETQRQWSDKAIARTTPALLGL